MPTLAERNRANRDKRKAAEQEAEAKNASKSTTTTSTTYDGDHSDLADVLNHIPCDSMDHDSWMKAGTVLKKYGIPFEAFDQWSSTDTREGEYKGTAYTRGQWDSFDVNADITSGWLVSVGKQYGWTQPSRSGRGYDWNDEVVTDDTIPSWANSTANDGSAVVDNQPSANTTKTNATNENELFDRMEKLLIHTDKLTGKNRRPTPKFLVDGLISEGSINMIAAPSKTGKSWAALELCWCVANGRPWMGAFECSGGHSGRVLYINIEITEDWLSQRLDDMLTRAEYHDGFMTMTLKGDVAVTLYYLRRFIAARHRDSYDLVCVDPLYLFEEGEENAAETWIPIMRELSAMQRECDASVVYVHHFSKGWPNQMPENRPAGSGVIGRYYEQGMVFSPRTLDADADRELQESYGENARAYEFYTASRNYRESDIKSVIWSWPFFHADTEHKYDLFPITGTHEAARISGGKRNAECEEELRAKQDAATSKAIEACVAAGKRPTRVNVLKHLGRACESLGIEAPSMDRFKRWTQRNGSTHWRVDQSRGNELHAVDLEMADEDGYAPFLPMSDE